MKSAVIITAHGAEGFTDFIPIAADNYLITADGGFDFALKLGVTPHVLVGDMDSITSAIPGGIEVIRLPVDKDDTDTHYCAKLALERGYNSITIAGGMSGRFDHTLANLHTLAFLANNGAQACMIDRDACVHVCTARLELKLPIGCVLSLFAYGGEAQGVSITGVKFPLEKATLTPDFPLGASNVTVLPNVCVSVGGGLLYVVIKK